MKLNYGIASPSTITRMLSGIDEELALYAFMEWIGEIVDSKNTHLAIDGKALRGAAEKTKSGTAPMLLNVVETVRGLILAQLPVDSKTNEITVIPELLKLLDIRGSVITIDAIGTQTAIMEQIHEQEGHFVLTVKKNQPDAYEEIHTFLDKLEEEAEKKGKSETSDPVMQDYLGKYEEINQMEKNRDRNEYRTCQICNNASNLTKKQKEWTYVQSIGRIKQVRIPVEKDSQGNDITPTKKEFLKKAVIAPFSDFMQRADWKLILLFVFLYKMSDAYMGPMANVFYYEMGFSLTEIASVSKIFGMGATILGGIVGGIVVSRWGLYKSLWICGILQGLTTLVFVLQAWSGHNIFMLISCISLDNISGGMSVAAFVAYLSSLCSVAYTATQYALLSSLMSLPRDLVAATSGYMAEAVGWDWFFVLTSLMVVPGLALLWILNKKGVIQSTPLSDKS